MERADTVKEQKRTARGEARTEAQRARILAAAQSCFVAHGFHAASMATISDTAQMSAGLIYRYFKSKNEIILAIIERQLEENQATIAALKSSAGLVTLMSETIARWRSGALDVFNPVLFLEMSAQAGRDPQIGQALANSDRVLSAAICDWLRQEARSQGQELSDKQLDMHRLALQCFIEGLYVRVVREPELDPRTVADSLKRFLLYLLPPEPLGLPEEADRDAVRQAAGKGPARQVGRRGRGRSA